MKEVPVGEAVGMVLCHDITEIVPGEFKGCAFKKGHIIQKEDIPHLLDIGKRNIYVWEKDENLLHEDEAGLRIANAAVGKGLSLKGPREGKVEFIAALDGILRINTEALFELNRIEEVMCATMHGNRTVKKGTTVAGTRVIPLVIDAQKIIQAEKICKDCYPLLEVQGMRKLSVGLVTTGSEVYHGRITDKFGPVIRAKVEEFGSHVEEQVLVDDSVEMIKNAIISMVDKGYNMICLTGGMSVDPDDRTPSGIRAAGGEVISYGAPVLPGAMFMLAYIGDVPVIGLPGCVMYVRTSVFDLVLPRLMAGEKLGREDIVRFAYGGLCLGCKDCHYPDCGFGKYL